MVLYIDNTGSHITWHSVYYQMSSKMIAIHNNWWQQRLPGEESQWLAPWWIYFIKTWIKDPYQKMLDLATSHHTAGKYFVFSFSTGLSCDEMECWMLRRSEEECGGREGCRSNNPLWQRKYPQLLFIYNWFSSHQSEIFCSSKLLNICQAFFCTAMTFE